MAKSNQFDNQDPAGDEVNNSEFNRWLSSHRAVNIRNAEAKPKYKKVYSDILEALEGDGFHVRKIAPSWNIIERDGSNLLVQLEMDQSNIDICPIDDDVYRFPYGGNDAIYTKLAEGNVDFAVNRIRELYEKLG